MKKLIDRIKLDRVERVVNDIITKTHRDYYDGNIFYIIDGYEPLFTHDIIKNEITINNGVFETISSIIYDRFIHETILKNIDIKYHKSVFVTSHLTRLNDFTSDGYLVSFDEYEKLEEDYEKTVKGNKI